MLLLVGLGNPGDKYARNRHNIGFRVLEAFADAQRMPGWKSKLGGLVTQGTVGQTKVGLLKPMEFMNLSGFAVQKTARMLGVAIDDIVVAHDEIDLDAGIVRIKTGGGHGGHNGLRSMIEQLGGNGFARIRIGVGKPGPQPGRADGGQPDSRAGDKNVAGWVLGDFPTSQANQVQGMIDRSVEALLAVCMRGTAKAMNELNGKPPV